MTITLKGSASSLDIDGSASGIRMSHSFFEHLRAQSINEQVSELVPLFNVSATRALDTARCDISADGSTMVTSNPSAVYNTFYPNMAGSSIWNSPTVTVFKRITNTWVQDAVFHMDNYEPYATEEQAYARDVSISGNGNTVVVADFRDASNLDVYPNGSLGGKIYIYTRTPTGWRTEILVPGDIIPGVDGKRFGVSLSISDNGKTIAVGAFCDSTAGYLSGAVYVYVKQSGVWTLQQKILSPDGTFSRFAFQLSLSGDGNSLAVGVPFDKANGGDWPSASTIGTAHVYTRSGGVWTHIQKFLPHPSDAVSTQFGTSMHISNDGSVLLIGGPANRDISVSPTRTNAGIVAVYRKVSGVWGPMQTLRITDFGEATRQSGNYGNSLAVTFDNTRIFVGGFGYGTQLFGGIYGTDIINTYGGIYIYKYNQTLDIFETEGALHDGGGCGYSISIDANNNIVSNTGVSCNYFLYDGNAVGLPWNETYPRKEFIYTTSDFTELAFGYDLSSSSTGATIASGCPYPSAGQKTPTAVDYKLSLIQMRPTPVAGSVYIYEREGDVWALQQKIQPNDSALDDMFGMSVDLSSDGNTLVVGAPQAKNGAGVTVGAIYIFTRSGITWTQVQKINPTNGVPDGKFGLRTRVSADGVKIFTSALRYSSVSNRVGTVYAYEKTITWDFIQQIIPNTTTTDTMFGGYIDVSSDGNVLVSGLYNDVSLPAKNDFDIITGVGTGVGQVQVFKKSGGLWILTNTINNTTKNFGRRLGVNSDGTVIAVSAEREQGTYVDQGAVHIYNLVNSNYVLNATITTDMVGLKPNQGVYFGSSVSINDVGDVIVVGADRRGLELVTGATVPYPPVARDSSYGDLFGVAYIYKKVNGVWTKQLLIKAKDGMFLDRHGWSCNISPGNSVITVGALSVQQNVIHILR